MSAAILLAVLIDLAFGEPKSGRHPVALIGRAMAKAGERLRLRMSSARGKRAMGTILVAGFVVASFALSSMLIAAANRLAPAAGWAANAMLIWLSISVGELIIICKKIDRKLESAAVGEARQLLRSLVGREAGELNSLQIRTAAIESLAENLVDAGIAPLFYAFIGGGTLAFTYRVINTMDSMFGYKNDKYVDFGWAAARIDDAASWLPARLTVACLALANRLGGRGFRNGIKAALRDGAKHPSPNSGLAMAALAGSLEIQLGGPRLYEGHPVVYGHFGKDIKPIDSNMINDASALAARTFLTVAVLGILIDFYIRGPAWPGL